MSRGSKPRNPVVANTEEVEEENLKKKFLKPLDKPLTLWYNKGVR